MSKSRPSFDDLLTLRRRGEVRAALAGASFDLSLPQAQRLTVHLEALEPAAHTLRLGVVHTYTSDLLDAWLTLAAALQGLRLATYHAPYGLAMQEARADSALVKHRPDVTLMLLQRGDLHPDLAQPLAAFDAVQQARLSEEFLQRLSAILSEFRKQSIGHIVLTLLPPLLPPGFGMYDAHAERSEGAWWAELKARIGRSLRESMQACSLLDLDAVVQQLGRAHFFDARFWYSARFPFTAEAACELARRVIGIGAVLKYPRAKVLALDADNTLWGGIVGEDGMNGIALGPEYPGNAYIDFQRRLLDYRQRGFILALCSKNNPADVEQVLQEHPHQILREEHFAARRVNWSPKPENLVALAEELNLGLDSFIFVDDSEHECELVRQQLPQVEVIQTPSRAVDVPRCLEQVARLEILSLTAEDLAKTELYAQERQRRELKAAAGGGGDYLASLQMRMKIGFNDAANLTRLSQLTQKTNQFNLTTRRYDEQQMRQFIEDERWLVAHFSLADIFGDSGIVGLALLRTPAPELAELDTFLMSCRVIGREAESAFLHALLRHLAAQGVDEVSAQYLPTLKNVLAKNFLPEQGFEDLGETRYRRDLRATPPKSAADFPIAVQLAP